MTKKIELTDLLKDIFQDNGIEIMNFDEDGNQINPNDYYYDKKGYLRKKGEKNGRK